MICFVLNPPSDDHGMHPLPSERMHRLRLIGGAIILSLVLLGSAGFMSYPGADVTAMVQLADTDATPDADKSRVNLPSPAGQDG